MVVRVFTKDDIALDQMPQVIYDLNNVGNADLSMSALAQ
jgi:hypothetical protein